MGVDEVVEQSHGTRDIVIKAARVVNYFDFRKFIPGNKKKKIVRE